MKKIKGNKLKNKQGKNKLKQIFNIGRLILMGIFAVLTLLLIINIIKLTNIENLIRVIIIVVLTLIFIGLIFFQKKKKILCMSLMLILSFIYSFLNYSFYRIYSSLDSITTKVETKGICLVTHLDDVKVIGDITKGDIAIVGESMDASFYDMALDIISDESLKNNLVEYEDYFQIINALINEEIDYAFLPENYNDIYNAGSGEEENIRLDFNILYTKQKVMENTTESVSTKELNEPFTMLLMGTDVILDSYNADTLMVLSVNPKTMKVTMLSIPRDTYAVIACTGGKHKINSSGWYGDSCVIKTVEKYLDIKIDYYAKINFLGIVDLVNDLGGIEVDVPYAFCEQNSKRQFGNSTVYVESGLQTLNGEQALALARNRHYWTGMCPAKYTSDGERNDITRGMNQQLVIKAILSKLMSVRDLNKFYDILDTVGANMTTNMSRETLLSFYNVGKNMVKRFNSSSADDIINIERLTFKSYSTRIFLSGLELSMIVNYDESVEYVSNQMKKNLGLIEEKPIKTFSFDINEDYDPDIVKYNKLTSNLRLFPSFVGKTLGDAFSYCNKNGISCDSSSDNLNAIISSQSIAAQTDIAFMKNKTVIFEVETVIPEVPEIDDDNSSEVVVPPIEEENPDNENKENKGEDGNIDSGDDDSDSGNDDSGDGDSIQEPPPVNDDNGEEEGSLGEKDD